MSKLKKPQRLQTSLTIKEYLDQYDSVTITGIIQSFETSPAWDIFRSYLRLRQREFEVASLDLIGRGQTHPAAHASGYAQGLEDTADKLITEFKNFALGVSPLVENNRPEEVEV